jgi:hypothetical protein
MIDKKIGATNKYPDGFIDEHDGGELRFSIELMDDKIIINFGTSVTWLGLTPREAIDLANILLKYANSITKN